MIKEIFKKIYSYLESSLNDIEGKLAEVREMHDTIKNSDFQLTSHKTNKTFVYYNEKKSKKGIKNFFGNLKEFKNQLEKKDLLTQFTKENREIEETLKRGKKVMSFLLGYITASGFQKPPKDLLDYFYGIVVLFYRNIIIEEELTEEKFVQFLCYAIKYKAEYYKRNKSLLAKMKEDGLKEVDEITICTEIADYFDMDGHVLANSNVSFLEEKLDVLYEVSSIKYQPKSNGIPTYLDFKNHILSFLLEQNRIKLEQDQPVKKDSTPIICIKDKQTNRLFHELSLYYKNGEIIKVCELDYLHDLLLSLPLSIEEQEKIYTKMKKALEEEHLEDDLYPFSPEEKMLLKKARNQIEKDNVRYFLEEIEFALLLIKEEPDHKEYGASIIIENLICLCYALHVDPEEIKLKKEIS